MALSRLVVILSITRRSIKFYNSSTFLSIIYLFTNQPTNQKGDTAACSTSLFCCTYTRCLCMHAHVYTYLLRGPSWLWNQSSIWDFDRWRLELTWDLNLFLFSWKESGSERKEKGRKDMGKINGRDNHFSLCMSLKVKGKKMGVGFSFPLFHGNERSWVPK